MALIHSNVNNQMILIHLNVSKLFKKQHTNTLHCFANRLVWMRAEVFSKEKFF